MLLQLASSCRDQRLLEGRALAFFSAEKARAFLFLKPNCKKYQIWLWILLFFAFLTPRHAGFFISHSDWDELIYQGLAYKLLHRGILGYSLSEISLRVHEQNPSTAEILLQEQGNLLKAYSLRGLGEVFDSNLFPEPPAFPMALALVNLLSSSGASKICQKETPEGLLRHLPFFQFPRALVPLFFSIVSTLFIFFLGNLLFNKRAAWIAAFLFATCPLDIVYSQKLLPTTMFTASFLGAITFSILGIKTEQRLLSIASTVASGFSLSIALLSEVQGFLILPILVILAYAFCGRRNILKPLTVLSSSLILGIILSSWWFIWMLVERGSLLYIPELLSSPDKRYELLNNLPWYFYASKLFRDQPLVLLIPLLLLNILRDSKKILLLLWIIVFYACLLALDHASYAFLKEQRLFLAAYPAVFLLLGKLIEEIFRHKMPPLNGKVVNFVIAITGFVFSIRGSVLAVLSLYVKTCPYY